ncbi:unnamed protein product [Anisakis simplex]|uniref:Uncharacterized protein n=1 Tax=Anisakis simplex TaxID=6269 RepID=A0A0M3JZQ5_ANISI|nr:unnamed protein product [Anisakis simplex]
MPRLNLLLKAFFTFGVNCNNYPQWRYQNHGQVVCGNAVYLYLTMEKLHCPKHYWCFACKQTSSLQSRFHQDQFRSTIDMSMRRSSRTHKAPVWVQDFFKPSVTSTPLYADIDVGPYYDSESSTAPETEDEIYEPSQKSPKSNKTVSRVNAPAKEMTHPKAKTSETNGSVVMANKQKGVARTRSRSRSRSRKSTPIKSIRRTSDTETAITPTITVASEVSPNLSFRRSTRIAERAANGVIKTDNNDEKPKQIQSDSVLKSQNETSFFDMDILSDNPRLMRLLQLIMLIVYLIVFYQICVYFRTDKLVAQAIRKWRQL